MIPNPQRRHAANPNRIQESHGEQIGLRLHERLCHPIQMSTPQNVALYLRQLVHFKFQLRMPLCATMQTRLQLLWRRHPKVKQQVTMDCTWEEYVQHLPGEICPVREEEVEIRSLTSAIQPLHQPLVLRWRRVYMNANDPPAIGPAQKLNPAV